MVPLGACKLSASCTRLCRHLLVCSASFPPFSNRPLAVAMDSPETCSKEEVTSRAGDEQSAPCTHLGEAVRAGLKDDQEHSNGHSLLSYLQSLSHLHPPQLLPNQVR